MDLHGASQIPDEDVEQFQHLMTRMVWLQRQRFGRMLNASGLTMPRFLVLAFIHEHGNACTMGQLAEATDQCSATMTGIVDRLVRMGLVERKQNPEDRRSVLVALTDPGRVLVEAAKHEAGTRLRVILARFTAEERKDIKRLLSRYVEILESENLDLAP